MAFRLMSTAFEDGEPIPVQHTADGPDLSPPLAWEDPPAGVRSFALIVTDPDAPGGTFTHWLRHGIPGTACSMGQGVLRARHLPDGSRQGRNGYGTIGWGGPAPPPGPAHRYVFRLLALESTAGPAAGLERIELEAALGVPLAEARLVGTYGR